MLFEFQILDTQLQRKKITPQKNNKRNLFEFSILAKVFFLYLRKFKVGT